MAVRLSFFDLFNTRIAPIQRPTLRSSSPYKSRGTHNSNTTPTAREGVFVSRQSITSFAVASSVVTLIWKGLGVLIPGWGTQVWVAFVVALAVGGGLYLIHVSDPERSSDTLRDRLVDGFVALVNCFVLFSSAIGLGQITAGPPVAPGQARAPAGIIGSAPAGKVPALAG